MNPPTLPSNRFRIEETLPPSNGIARYRCADLESAYRYLLCLSDRQAEVREGCESYWRTTLVTQSGKGVVYGVLDGRYLVSISHESGMPGAWPIDKLLSSAPADDLLYFGLWELIALQMATDANSVDEGRMSEAAWNERWSYVAGGPILIDAVGRYLEAGDLSRTEVMRVLTRLSQTSHQHPELAESLLIRLIGALSRTRIVMEEFDATLCCENFRRNVTRHEIQQIRCTRDALWSSFGLTSATSLDSLDPIQVMNIQSNPEFIYLDFILAKLEEPAAAAGESRRRNPAEQRQIVEKCSPSFMLWSE